MALIFVDCEAFGGCPRLGRLTEFGAVEFETRKTFHGEILVSKSSAKNPAVPVVGKVDDAAYYELALPVYERFATWLSQYPDRSVFVSDNPAFDWQWINDGFLNTLGHNPFGHSARRISDYYAGLRGDFRKTQQWKRLRVTPHDHNPVNDAMGNVEAFERLQKGER